MTIGMLLEMLLGKYSVQKGQTGDGTPFIKDMTLEQIGEWLHRECGIQRFGHEKLINGMTGEPIEALVFVAPCYYQRLKHMVVDKIHGMFWLQFIYICYIV
jgi:DNA-directed RNA polymerase II subunit RPB2